MPIVEETVLSFVRSSIRSAWMLELLLLLRRDPQRQWTTDALVDEVRGSIALVTESLKTLREIGLVALTDAEAYFYRPETPELNDLAAALVELYRQKPTTVLKTIFTSPSDKIQSFSDAFLIGRDDKK
ncbi:MAG: hypothetical protein AB7H90_16340 [Alphaproteobacteria bacterium]